MKPAIITLKIVPSGRKNPRWNYAEYTDLNGKNLRLEPCCLKAKPCWECK